MFLFFWSVLWYLKTQRVTKKNNATDWCILFLSFDACFFASDSFIRLYVCEQIWSTLKLLFPEVAETLSRKQKFLMEDTTQSYCDNIKGMPACTILVRADITAKDEAFRHITLFLRHDHHGKNCHNLNEQNYTERKI